MESANNTEDGQYSTMVGVSKAETRVKKSRFIGLATSVSTERDAMDFLRNVRTEFPNATHYCYAFSIGFDAKRLVRCNDAGEPANSAGKPILSGIESSEFHNVICVVVRYFGGTKLGIGGLIRAYGQTARDCLENAVTVVRVPTVSLRIETPQAYIGGVVRLLGRFKARILRMDHGEKTVVAVHIRCSMVPPLEENIRAISRDIVVVPV